MKACKPIRGANNMDYEFPIINHINDILPHLVGFPNIIVMEKDGYTVIDYVVDDTVSFKKDDGVGYQFRRECRGIIFNTATGKIIRRPFQKFYNINQIEETLEVNLISLMNDIQAIMFKEDGSMMAPFMLNDKVCWGTRKGITDHVSLLESDIHLRMYEDDIRAILNFGITPMFEYVSPNNKIVLKYKTANLILIGARDMVTGKYVSIYDPMFANFEKVLNYKNTQSLSELIESIKNATGIEGVVVAFNNGHRVKCKGDEYCFLHRSNDDVADEKGIWMRILDGTIDDFIPKLDADNQLKVAIIDAELWPLINAYKDHMNGLFDIAMENYGGDKKRVALEWKDIHPTDKSMLFAMMSGKEVTECVVKMVMGYCHQNIQHEKIKAFLKGFMPVENGDEE